MFNVIDTDDKARECAEMWAEHQRSAESHWAEHFGRDPMPEDLIRFLRNDGVADWLEVCILRD